MSHRKRQSHSRITTELIINTGAARNLLASLPRRMPDMLMPKLSEINEMGRKKDSGKYIQLTRKGYNRIAQNIHEYETKTSHRHLSFGPMRNVLGFMRSKGVPHSGHWLCFSPLSG